MRCQYSDDIGMRGEKEREREEEREKERKRKRGKKREGLIICFIVYQDFLSLEAAC
jgi:hypothetical protein